MYGIILQLYSGLQFVTVSRQCWLELTDKLLVKLKPAFIETKQAGIQFLPRAYVLLLILYCLPTDIDWQPEWTCNKKQDLKGKSNSQKLIIIFSCFVFEKFQGKR